MEAKKYSDRINESDELGKMEKTYQLNLLINRLYTASSPFTKHKCSDTDWHNVRDHIAALRKVRGVTDVISGAGVYCNYFAGTSPHNNRPAYRKYEITIETEYGTVEGQLICHSAGTTDDVFSSYDMSCTFWKPKEQE